MAKKTFRRKAGKRRTRRVRRTRRRTHRRRTIKGGGYVVPETLNMLYPDLPKIIASVKNIPRYADALNNGDGSNEDTFRIIYNEFSQHALENRQQRLNRPDLTVSWIDDDGVEKSTTFYLHIRDGLDISMPNNPQSRSTIYHV